jgi:hypothetical protein
MANITRYTGGKCFIVYTPSHKTTDSSSSPYGIDVGDWKSGNSDNCYEVGLYELPGRGRTFDRRCLESEIIGHICRFLLKE